MLQCYTLQHKTPSKFLNRCSWVTAFTISCVEMYYQVESGMYRMHNHDILKIENYYVIDCIVFALNLLEARSLLKLPYFML